MKPVIIRSLPELRKLTAHWVRREETIGLVPTMGALHPGHLSLAKAARVACDRVIVTIFVNPKQFNNLEDLAKYPRTEHDDAEKLAPIGVDAIFVPAGDQMYPKGFSTNVSVDGLTDVLCGAHRPGHFDGVATVVAKLFLQSGANQAFFGEKDFQQLQVVRRMARDLDMPISVVGCPTIREDDGLAMSSRNLNLSEAARKIAPNMQQVMQDVAAGLRMGKSMDELRPTAIARLKEAGFGAIDYLDLRAMDDLASLDTPHRAARLFAAAYLGDVRLIDNIAV